MELKPIPCSVQITATVYWIDCRRRYHWCITAFIARSGCQWTSTVLWPRHSVKNHDDGLLLRVCADDASPSVGAGIAILFCLCKATKPR